MRKVIERTAVDPLFAVAWRSSFRPLRRLERPLALALLLLTLPLQPLVALVDRVLRRRLRAAGSPHELATLRDLAERLARWGEYRAAARIARYALAIAPDDAVAARVLRQALAEAARPGRGGA